MEEWQYQRFFDGIKDELERLKNVSVDWRTRKSSAVRQANWLRNKGYHVDLIPDGEEPDDRFLMVITDKTVAGLR